VIAFRVWCEEEGGTEDDARTFEALDHQQAAEDWAQRDDSDSAEYRIVGERWTAVVHVSGSTRAAPCRCGVSRSRGTRAPSTARRRSRDRLSPLASQAPRRDPFSGRDGSRSARSWSAVLGVGDVEGEIMHDVKEPRCASCGHPKCCHYGQECSGRSRARATCKPSWRDATWSAEWDRRSATTRSRPPSRGSTSAGLSLSSTSRSAPSPCASPASAAASSHRRREFATKATTPTPARSCGAVWRPAVVATVGCGFLPGFKNEPEDDDSAPGSRCRPQGSPCQGREVHSGDVPEGWARGDDLPVSFLRDRQLRRRRWTVHEARAALPGWARRRIEVETP